MSILLFLLIINTAVVVHELAHYYAARRQGVNVRAFSVGMGPILARRQWRGTEWRLSALPIGGYVDIDGLGATPGPDGQPVAPTTGMARLPYLGKVWILFAGPLSNIVLALLLIAGVLWGQGQPTVVPGRAVLAQIVPGSAAERAGLQRGDVVVSVDGRPVSSVEEVRASLRQNGERVFGLERDGRPASVRFTWAPTVPPGGERPLFGISIGSDVRYERLGPLQALRAATVNLLGGVPQAIAGFVRGVVGAFSFSGTGGDVVGPVGTVGIVGQAAQSGIWAILSIAGLLNFSLGIFNLLPIPGLDGGRILLSTIVALRGRPFKPGQEEFINFLGFAFVLVFIGLVTLQGS